MRRSAQVALFEVTQEDYETPAPLFAALDAEFGFTVDVAASSENAKCARYFTIVEDGLAQDWSGERCFMNPPYGRQIGRWVQKAATCGALVVAVLPVRTDTGWWHDHVIGAAAEVRFLRGRLRFRPKRPGGGNGAPFPSAVVIWGDTPEPRVEE